MADDEESWRHPWFRVNRVIRMRVGQRWSGEQWAIVKSELRNAMALRQRIRRAGWFT